MRSRLSRVAPALLLLAAGLHPACEKETHRAARRTFQEILARDLSPEGRAAALEEFVGRYPEPKTNPHLVRACGLIADHHARAGRPDIAARWYEQAVRASPEDPDLLNALGYHYARNRLNLERAVLILRTAARLAEERGYSPRRRGFIKDSLGWAYRMRGDLPASVALLEEASRLAPGVPVIQEHMAESYRAAGDKEKAAALYLDLFLAGRGTSPALRESLRALGREGGQAYAREIERRINRGLEAIVEADRRDTAAAGATLVQLRAADGIRLYGSLYQPRGRPPSRPGGVLLLHPLGSTRAACAATARALAGRGLVALAIDLRGHGASVGEALPDPHAFSARLAIHLEAAEQDVRAGLDFLERRTGVDPRRLGLVGAGLGAFLAARAVAPAGTAARPVALVLLSPWGSPEAYRDPLSRLPPEAVFLTAGSEEGAALTTARALVPDDGSVAPVLRIVVGPGAQFDLAATDPALVGTIASFVEARLARPARGLEVSVRGAVFQTGSRRRWEGGPSRIEAPFFSRAFFSWSSWAAKRSR